MFLSLLSRLSLILYCSPLQALPTNFQGQYYCAPSVIKYAGFKSSLFNRRLAKRTKLNNSTSIGGKHQIVGIMSFVSSSKPLLFKEICAFKILTEVVNDLLFHHLFSKFFIILVHPVNPTLKC